MPWIFRDYAHQAGKAGLSFDGAARCALHQAEFAGEKVESRMATLIYQRSGAALQPTDSPDKKADGEVRMMRNSRNNMKVSV